MTVIPGLGGQRLSEQHAIHTGMAVSAMNPSYLSALTLMVVPGTVLHDMIRNGLFDRLINQLEILRELELMIMNMYASGPVVFRTNHVSNYVTLKGTLPQEQKYLLETIRYAVQNPVMRRSESLRGL